jgi:hypothetical protein
MDSVGPVEKEECMLCFDDQVSFGMVSALLRGMIKAI